ncbi:MAG TPA: alpha/beta hydrolase, partial [Bryobacteraceae bacterium]|nr:alpha/beta hydrolase [Bryobacteraceae bacterium]
VATPFQLLAPLLLGLIALAMLGAAAFLLLRTRKTPLVAGRRGDAVVHERISRAGARWRRRTLVGIALAMLLGVGFGRHLVSLVRPSGDAPQDAFGAVTRRVTGPSGAELAVEESGPQDAPRIIFTHGWGADRREWSYARRRLEDRFRVVAWDLPGLGQSKPIPSGDYALENMAADLRAVIDATGSQPAILVGHSIGGMLNLTLCKRNGGAPGANVQGIVQLNTTYTNPVRTVKGHELQEKLQKPVYEPLLHVITEHSPVVRGVNWLGYQSGLVHLQTASSSFAGTETREQLDFASRYYYRSSPAVVARGTLGMLHWDASDVLDRIPVPVLIVSGDQDTTTLPVASDHMSEKIPRDMRVSVSPAAHLGPIEQHERYNTAIETFATRLRGEGQASRQATP